MATDGDRTQRVVVGVDGSAPSITALKWAAAYTAGCGGTLTALLAWHYPAAAGPAPIGVAPESVTEDVRAHLAETLTKAIAEAAPDTAVEQQIAYGHPAQVLVDASRDADLLVVASRGHGGFTGMLIGSVSIHCVTHAHCPVVVVRSGS